MTSENGQWTAAHIPDQQGRVFIITGGNSGIGYEAARALAGKRAAIVLAVRSLEKGEQAAAAIRRETPQADVQVMALDLADLAAIEAFAGAFRARFDRLDVLINNAGVMAIPRRQTVDGFEMQFGTNHLGHFALTGHLLELLLATPGARVVTVSSNMHRQGKMAFDNLNVEAGYSRYGAYSRSKLANLLFAFELQRRLEASGAGAISVGCHPGYAATNLQNAGPEMDGSAVSRIMMQIANALFAQDAAMGALPTLYAATVPDVNGCDYIGPAGFMRTRGYPAKEQARETAYNAEDAARLWALSEAWTGVTYDALAPVDAVR